MMNKTKNLLLAGLLSLAGLFTAQGQNKFGYIEFQSLLVEMPDYKKANTDMEAYGKQFQDQLRTMSTELDTKYNDYQKNEGKMPEAIKELKQKELRDMQMRIQEFQETAQEKIRDKETELLKPIIEKAKKAIADVAKENGYSYIFDSSPGTPLLYKPEGDDVMKLVMKKLGIVAPPVTPAPAQK
jgi:outer membrane protein